MIDLIAARMVLGELAAVVTRWIARPTRSRQRSLTGVRAALAMVRRTARSIAVMLSMRVSAPAGRCVSAGVSAAATATAATVGEGRKR